MKDTLIACITLVVATTFVTLFAVMMGDFARSSRNKKED